MNAAKVAAITGVSVRTLHHYDRIGLLCPARNRENDYRRYAEADLDQLQQILFFKTCGFPLAQIKRILHSPEFDRDAAMELQKKALLHEKARIEAMLGTLERTMNQRKGGPIMSQKEKFRGFDFSQNPYKEEARQRWGDEMVDQSTQYLNSRSKGEQDAIAKGMEELFHGLAKIRTEDPASEIAQEAMAGMYRQFNERFGVSYSLEAFAGVGQLYVTDSRFTETMDRYGTGLAVFLAEAMAIYAKQHT